MVCWRLLATVVAVGILLWRQKCGSWSWHHAAAPIDGSVAVTGLVTYEAALFAGGPGWWIVPLWLWLSIGVVVPMAAMSLNKCYDRADLYCTGLCGAINLACSISNNHGWPVFFFFSLRNCRTGSIT